MTGISDWVERYRRAWETNDPDDIRAVFTDDAVYRMSPSAAPWVGSDAIIAGWLENQDAAGTTTFEWQPVAVEGSTAVIRCVTGYPGGEKAGTYDNLWVVRIAADGRATEFTDWWIERR
jgi:ketosteroid isomerase-like protein